MAATAARGGMKSHNDYTLYVYMFYMFYMLYMLYVGVKVHTCARVRIIIKCKVINIRNHAYGSIGLGDMIEQR